MPILWLQIALGLPIGYNTGLIRIFSAPQPSLAQLIGVNDSC